MCIVAAVFIFPLKIAAADPLEPVSRLMQFAGNIHQFNTLHPQEKVYLHFDNTAYFSGETIWFKAYVVNASTLMRPASTVLYVDLVSPSGVILQQQKLKIVAGQADGCIHLMDQATAQARQLRGILPYPSGYYEIRAYTQFMMNFSPDAIFSRVFPVYQQPEKQGNYDERILAQGKWTEKDRPEALEPDDLNVIFYPEGGQLVRGLESHVAFKATGKDGGNLNGTLTLKSDDGTVTAATVHNGMGEFTVTPGLTPANATFTTANGASRKFSLPRAGADGLAVHVTQNGPDSIRVNLTNNETSTVRLVGLTVTCRGELFHYEYFNFNTRHNKQLDIYTGGWPMGVCNMTFYNDHGDILATRAIFHSNPGFKPPVISVATDKAEYKPFEHISMSFNLTDGRDGRAFRDRFCVSVRDASDYGTAFSDNILTDFLLSSDLKGCIEKPEYYFEAYDEEHQRALDLLCMVQGWSNYSRYNWLNMTDLEPYEEKRRLEDSLSVNGWILSNRLRKNQYKAGMDVFMSIQPLGSETVEWARYTTGDIGYFGFNAKDFYGKADLRMIVERKSKTGTTEADRRTRIRLERALVPEPRMIDPAEKRIADLTVLKERQEAEILEKKTGIVSADGIILPEVTIKERRRYIDYFTFRAFDVEKDVEADLDLGEYPDDVMGYLLRKGYSVLIDEYGDDMNNWGHEPEAERRGITEMFQMADSVIKDDEATHFVMKSEAFIDDSPVFWYVHNNQEFLYSGYDKPWTIDSRDIAGILVYDTPYTPSEIRESVPLYMDIISRRQNSVAQQIMNNMVNGRQFQFRLVDIQVKEDAQIMSEKAKRNLGQRISSLNGFTVQTAQFYSPQYPEGPIHGDEDYRRTLYWNPNVITDSLGHAEIDFYNNSYSTHFTVSGCGITASGTPYVLDADF